RRETADPSPATALALSSWDLARTRGRLPDTPRGQVMTLRTHKRLLDTCEDDQGIPEADRSYLRVREDARGSALLVHGVSTRPGDLHVLASKMYDAGYNVYVLRLPDYGRPNHTISEVSWEAALEQVRQRFRLLARGGAKVHVVGLGFGAALAVHLASLESVSALVLLSPAIMPRESLFQRLLVRLKVHRVRALHRWIGWNTDLMEGMDAARGKVPSLKVPVYGAQCEDDDRASPESVRILQRKARHEASRFRIFPAGGHAILTVHGEDTLYADIIDFCGDH
ncbi:MAG: alpha/beta fold hydrolase, partial [Krumholzibacteria bacterium]|nr:alpha/beta fold hydrolase [Candidatus Krumholzibacteria bacterium]